jgi:hypothetical protein
VTNKPDTVRFSIFRLDFFQAIAKRIAWRSYQFIGCEVRERDREVNLQSSTQLLEILYLKATEERSLKKFKPSYYPNLQECRSNSGKFWKKLEKTFAPLCKDCCRDRIVSGIADRFSVNSLPTEEPPRGNRTKVRAIGVNAKLRLKLSYLPLPNAPQQWA